MEPTFTSNHIHTATPTSIHDGDTFQADVELDFWVVARVTIRVHNLFCAELSEPGGLAAATAARGLLTGMPVTLRSYKDELSYKRWICDVWLPDGRSFAEVMNLMGHGGKGAGT